MGAASQLLVPKIGAGSAPVGDTIRAIADLSSPAEFWIALASTPDETGAEIIWARNGSVPAGRGASIGCPRRRRRQTGKAAQIERPACFGENRSETFGVTTSGESVDKRLERGCIRQSELNSSVAISPSPRDADGSQTTVPGRRSECPALRSTIVFIARLRTMRLLGQTSRIISPAFQRSADWLHARQSDQPQSLRNARRTLSNLNRAKVPGATPRYPAISHQLVPLRFRRGPSASLEADRKACGSR
jgi:hypothetical protein